MRLPLQITYLNMLRSEAVERRIREHAEQLDGFHEEAGDMGPQAGTVYLEEKQVI